MHRVSILLGVFLVSACQSSSPTKSTPAPTPVKAVSTITPEKPVNPNFIPGEFSALDNAATACLFETPGVDQISYSFKTIDGQTGILVSKGSKSLKAAREAFIGCVSKKAA